MADTKKYLIPVYGLALMACGNNVREKPNVIYVFPDQFRNQSLAFWDRDGYSEYVKWQADPVSTPNLDKFADEALVLSKAVSTCPLSSPYRGMFLTGMYPERSGITLNCMALRPESTLNPDATCISDVLAANGYSCGYIGKLHAETPMKNDPANPGHYVSDRDPEWDAYTPPERRHGFSYWYSYGTFDVHKNPHYWDTDGVRHDPGEYSVKHETDKAIEFLRNRNGERKDGAPFFLALAYNPPHSPYEKAEDCMAEDYALYEDMDYRELYVRPNADTTLSKAPAARYYFANVTGVDREFGRLMAELERLEAKYPPLYTFGNHEFYQGLIPWQFKFKNMGFLIMFNHGVRIPDHNVYIAGIPDAHIANNSDVWNVNFLRAFKGAREGSYRILLSHTPDFVDYLNKENVDLQLSGHTHGGQIFPFHIFAKYANKYLSGLYEVNGVKLYVSNGAGYWGPAMRLFAPSEITVIDLKAQPKPQA